MTTISESTHPWRALELHGPATAREIKRAYAVLAKRTRPDVDPEGFQQLRAAYELALQWAVSPDTTTYQEFNTSAQTSTVPRQENFVNDEQSPSEEQVSSRQAGELETAQTESSEPASATSIHENFDTSPSAEQQEWQRLMDEIHALSAVVYETTQPLTDAQASRLDVLVAMVLAHSALLDLSVALRTEEQLLALAAHSNLWPADSLRLLSTHYQLESRLAFSDFWSTPASIQRQIEDHDRWRELRLVAMRDPQSTPATVMRNIDFSDRWRLWLSYEKRVAAHAQLDWVQQRPLLFKPGLDAASVAALSKWLQFLNLWPHLGVTGWIFLFLCSFGIMNSLSDWLSMPLIKPNESPNFLLVVALLYAACFGIKKWLLPVMQGWQHRVPRVMDASELVAAWLVIVSFGVGGWAPVLSAGTLAVAGVWLLSSWAIHNRLRPFLSAMASSDNIPGSVLLLVSALCVLYTLAPNPSWFAYPIAVLAVFQCFLGNPPLTLDQWTWKYQWRNGQPIGIPLRIFSISALLLLVVLSTVIIYQRGLYDGSSSSGIAYAALTATWLVFGIFTGANLSQHFRASMGGFAALAYPLALIAVVTAFQQQLGMKGVGLWHLAVATSIGISIAQTLFAQYSAVRLRT